MNLKTQTGFSMIELLIAIAISSILITLMSGTYYLYSNVSQTQDRVVSVNQKLRSVIYLLERDLLMAGFDSDPTNPAGTGFSSAQNNSMTFTFVENSDGIDNDGDGTTDEVNELETVDYTFSSNTIFREDSQSIDSDSDGTIDPDVLANDIEAVEFYYTLEDGSQSTSVNAGNLDKIRSVTVSVLGRSQFNAKNFNDNTQYTTPSGASFGPFNDSFVRRLLTTTVSCRNIR
jgi:type IV pilus assembly protein PilW